MADFSKFYLNDEIFFEIALLLFAQWGHFLQLDNGGSIYFRFLLLTLHKGRVEDVADNEIFTNHATLLKLQCHIACEAMFVGEYYRIFLIFFDDKPRI